ncbi:hypothetical protein R3P38DRAFT_895133 [Favolaschia claudopus]|uniref:Uncharacterized protein n=1 Tax=Favolaschia claudopus TaxID=2862362 RepID=A0AAW0BTS0_9AGAR
MINPILRAPVNPSHFICHPRVSACASTPHRTRFQWSVGCATSPPADPSPSIISTSTCSSIHDTHRPSCPRVRGAHRAFTPLPLRPRFFVCEGKRWVEMEMEWCSMSLVRGACGGGGEGIRERWGSRFETFLASPSPASVPAAVLASCDHAGIFSITARPPSLYSCTISVFVCTASCCCMESTNALYAEQGGENSDHGRGSRADDLILDGTELVSAFPAEQQDLFNATTPSCPLRYVWSRLPVLLF